MADAPGSGGTAPADSSAEFDDGELATIGLRVGADENRRLLRDWLGQWYHVIDVGPDEPLPEGTDLWVVGSRLPSDEVERLQAAKAEAAPAYLPLLFLAEPDGGSRPPDRLWSTFDEVVELPVPRAELHSRIEALLRTRRLSRELAQERDRLESFAGFLAHDLRNPLTVALGSLEAAREDGDSRAFDALERALDRIEARISDALALARKGAVSLDPGPVDLAAVSEEAWANFEVTGARLEADAVALTADAEALERLLENLFRNAVEHGSAEDASVTVRVGALDGGFYVEDDGPGIPPAERETVFEPHTSSVRGGTGLGLAIVRRLAEAHDWTVACVAAEAGGARFEFRGVEPA